MQFIMHQSWLLTDIVTPLIEPAASTVNSDTFSDESFSTLPLFSFCLSLRLLFFVIWESSLFASAHGSFSCSLGFPLGAAQFCDNSSGSKDSALCVHFGFRLFFLFLLCGISSETPDVCLVNSFQYKIFKTRYFK